MAKGIGVGLLFLALYIARFFLGAFIIYITVNDIIDAGAVEFWDVVFILVGIAVSYPKIDPKD